MDLNIAVVNNGFVVSEITGCAHGQRWVFETSDALAKFLKKWGKEQEDERVKS